ncbi:hypothetical protein EVAR_67138_1 [Eumeta japonica]|uniref:Uncharacterized protein n=1 Tax=Eumeta variegata TaxID=151549 RepID=A0A4C1ZRJ6_EUMVA|nr:hypothetical protein EVAR_67138_1 [Eumeta japonica]
MKSDGYIQHVEHLLIHFQQLGCDMSIKLHYLHSYLDYFLENVGDLSEEQGKRFHQDICTVEERHQGYWNGNMLADYCWSIHNNTPHARKSCNFERPLFATINQRRRPLWFFLEGTFFRLEVAVRRRPRCEWIPALPVPTYVSGERVLVGSQYYKVDSNPIANFKEHVKPSASALDGNAVNGRGGNSST